MFMYEWVTRREDFSRLRSRDRMANETVNKVSRLSINKYTNPMSNYFYTFITYPNPIPSYHDTFITMPIILSFLRFIYEIT